MERASGPGRFAARAQAARPGGRFLVLEGVEGAGKTTQTTRLVSWLESRGKTVVRAREPGGTGVGEAIRNLLLHRDDYRMPAETELMLMLAARAAFVRELVDPALARGDWVVADRFDFSTFAYQGYGRGLDLERVRAANAFATGGRVPDLYLVLDVPVSVGRARQRQEGKADDRIEREGEAFLDAVRNGYLELARSEPRARVVDAGGPADEVHDRIVAAVLQVLPELGGGAQG